jgi:hypothetical protein
VVHALIPLMACHAKYCGQKINITLYQISKNCIPHTKISIQYCSKDCEIFYRRLISDFFMSIKFSFHYNAITKTFFKSIKAEMIWFQF